MALGLPILIFWVISLPVFALVLMYKNVYKDKRQDNKIKKYFLILYQGLKDEHFYWEFVNSLKKIIILLSFVLPDPFKIIVSVVTLVISWRIQKILQPYKLKDNNETEMIGVNVGITTLCSGMIYNSSDTHSGLNSVLLVVMVFLNIFFILQWLYLFSSNSQSKYKMYLNKILKIILFKSQEGILCQTKVIDRLQNPASVKIIKVKNPK